MTPVLRAASWRRKRSWWFGWIIASSWKSSGQATSLFNQNEISCSTKNLNQNKQETGQENIDKVHAENGSGVYVEVRSKIRIFSRPTFGLQGNCTAQSWMPLQPAWLLSARLRNTVPELFPYLSSRHAGSRAYSYSFPFKPYSWSWENREVEDGSWSTNSFSGGFYRSQLSTTMPSWCWKN
jgi:hypothetical protein